MLVVLGACGGAATSTAPTTTTTTAARCIDSENDLSQEPPYTANYLYRFKDADGCEVRLDVMMLRRPGPDHHCAGWPDEIVFENRIYVRDPDGTWREPSLPHGFAADVARPAAAHDTGYVSDAGRLFVDPADNRWIYIETSGKTERWPLEKQTGCV